jgi:hypothetical protein
VKKLFQFLFCLLLDGFFLQAQENLNFPPPLQTPILKAIPATERIVIDGKLNEKDWGRAMPIDDFFRMEPRQGGKYLHKTEVKVVYDDKQIYFGVFCKDSLGEKGIRVQDLRRDFSYGENDIFYLQLDPQNTKRFCVSFQTTPYGNQRDLQVFDGNLKDNDWDALWSVRTTRTDSGYYAEFGIPFKSLRYDNISNKDSVAWGITFARLARRDYEQTVFPAIPQSYDPYRMTYAAKLVGLKLPEASSNIRISPYSLFQNDKNTDASGVNRVTTKVKIGGEAKWAVNPHAVLDFTVNTDFAQADVDRVVNNLTRFNVLFPERRQFFLENNGIYAGADISNIKPFFSRTIGLSSTQFNANPISIDAGVRYTDRNQKRTLAGLYVHQRAGESQGASSFGVLRYLKNYGNQNNIGVMVTHRLDEADQLKGYTTKNNTTVTVDGFIRPVDEVTIQYLASASRNNTNDSLGIAGSLYVGWNPNKLYMGWLSDFVSEKYVPGMGFVFANNTIKHNPGGYFIWRPKNKLGKYIRRWDPGAFVNWYQNSNNFKTQEVSLYIFPIYIITNTNAKIEYAITPSYQNLPFSFPVLKSTIESGQYRFVRQVLRYETDASRKFSIQGKYEWGNYYNGKLKSLNVTSRFAPLPQVALTAGYEYNVFAKLGVTSDDFNTSLYSVGIRLAANPRLQVSSFYQYNSFDYRGRLNVRASWEFAPLSFVYFVFNDQQFQNTSIANQSVITKISYIKQF